ncbi:unnamed protein product [Orchesella dallaii]|uniref:Nucleoporin Nup159/Nup146 N-terminal domain-containing protein n=1 Tax=Orchesella dallaii TaxID=48710 RepID=A0ABP1R862_9HEXA
MASAPPVINEGPPMVEVKHLFFQAYPAINYFSNEAEADAVNNEVAFQHFNRGLECSNKYGCLLLAFNSSFYLLRVKDIREAQNKASLDSSRPLCFQDVKKLEIKNDALQVSPNIIALSNGEDYLAVDTVRGDSAWVVVFQLSEFINQGGACRPFCEIRCSSSASARISNICWNPGENMNNLVAINSADGILFLAKINGPNSIELNKFSEGGVRCLCWSPKGKQLVIGRSNGMLSQLKLDLTEAKRIPGPHANSVPISILWTQTTQFLIVFHKETFIDLMQLDLAKNAPPIYSNSGDIFISDSVPTKSSCFFLPFMQWNAVVAMTNSASDIIVLVKQPQNELWTPGDIADNQRAAFLLDNYARGATVFYGSEDKVIVSEVESHPPMPLLFLLSQRGCISSYSLVNSDSQVPSLNVKVVASVPDSVFSVQSIPRPMPQALPSFQLSGNTVPPSLFQAPATNPPASLFTSSATNQPASLFTSSSTNQPASLFQVPATNPPASLFQAPQPNTAAVRPQQSTPSKPIGQPALLPTPQQPGIVPPKSEPQAATLAGQKLGGFIQQADPRLLATSTLPTAKDMAVLQKAVEEKRREMTTQLQKGNQLKGLEDDDQCAFVLSEIRKFEKRLQDFVSRTDVNRKNLNGLLNTSFENLEKNVLSTLTVVEDFVSDMVATTSAQREEVDVLKERILNHFSQLEYAKSVVERSRDPRYLEHLRSQPLDPATRQKFQEISKMHNYIKNQVGECRKAFYEQKQKKDTPFDRISLTQLIYLTLSNHSQIIRRLNTELDKIKQQLGLGKHLTAFDEAEFLAVCEANYSGGKHKASSSSKVNNDIDEITLTDLTAGISRVKLNRESDRADRKPIRFANKKLRMVKNCMSEVSVLKVKADEAPWTRTTSKPTRPKPVSYPVGSFESSFSRIMMQSEVDASKLSSGSSSAGDKVKHTSVPASNLHSLIGSTVSTLGTSSMTKSSEMPSLNPISSYGQLITSSNTSIPRQEMPVKLSETSSITNITPPGSSSASITSQAMLRNVTQASFLNNPSMLGGRSSSPSTPPSVQVPVLASLLSTPPSAPLSSSTNKSTLPSSATPALFSSSAVSFASSTSTTSGLFSTGGLSFGTFPGSEAPKGTPAKSINSSLASLLSTPTGSFATAASPNITSVRSVAPSSASQGSPVNLSVSSNPVGSSVASPIQATSVSSPIVSAKGLTSTSVLGLKESISKAQSLSSPVSSESAAKVPAVSTAGIPSSAVGTPVLPSASSPSAFGLNLSGASGKTSTSFNVSSGGLFSSFANPANGASIFGTGSVATTAQALPSFNTVATSVSSKVSEVPSTVQAVPVSTSSAESPAVTASSPSSVSELTSTVTSPPATTAPTGGLFSASTLPFTSPGTTSSGIFGGGSLTFGTPASTVSAATSTSTTAVTTAPSGLFTGTPTTGGLFSAAVSASPGSTLTLTAAAVSSSATPGLFTAPSSSTGGSPFTTLSTSTATTGLFGTTSATSPPTGLFSSVAPVSSTTPAAGFMSALSLSDSTNQTAPPTSTAGAGLFSSPAFGGSSAATSAASIFGGGGSTFASQTTNAATGGIFGSGTTTQTAFGTAVAKPASTGFGSPAAATSVFGGSATFGTSSPFGSSFGTSTTSAFGTASGNVFGNTTSTQSAGFGALAQTQSNTTSTFGSPFGGSQQQSSIFGSPAQTKPTATGGLFSAPAFGSPVATSAGSIFGGGSTVFGGTSASGAFSTGASTGGVAQQGFGFGQTKPSTGTAFGSPPAVNPVFGGGATFGSTSPFGTSFGSSPNSAFGSTGASVFGGSAATQTAGFGALAQQGSSTPGFGSPGGFGAAQQPQQQQPSLFGSPTQQQPKPVFGGQAFSSWR